MRHGPHQISGGYAMSLLRRLRAHVRNQRKEDQAMTGVYLQIYPSPLVNASRMYKIAKSVHQAGYFDETHLVGVQTGTLESRNELAPGVSIIRIRGSSTRGTLSRVLLALLWQPRVYVHYHRETLAVIAAHNVWVLPLCWLLSRRTGASLVYNAHELETETLSMRGLKQRAAKLIESRLITKCLLVSVVNSSIADWYEREYSIRRPVVVGNVPVVKDAEVRLRERLGVTPNEMLYIHTGNLVEGRNIPLILSAFSTSPHHLVFLGDGHLRGAVLRASAIDANIHWLPPVDPDLIVAHVREADVGLCLIENHLDLSDRFSSPNKLLESLAADVPPLCSELVEARTLLGPLADRWTLTDPMAQLVAALGHIGKEDVEQFKSEWPGATTWEAEVEPLVAAYRGLFAPNQHLQSYCDKGDASSST